MLDVCLVVEGTYPFVTGGVSAWINDLIAGLPSVRFGIVHLGPTAGLREPRYPIHDNIAHFSEVAIHGRDLPCERTAASSAGARRRFGSGRAARREAFRILERFYRSLPQRLATGDFGDIDAPLDVLAGRGPHGLAMSDLLQARESWDLLTRLYETLAPGESFLDFFWTSRYTHLPLLRLLRAQLPPAAVYHTLSTGYAGFAAAVASRRTGAPLLLTEHGIYTKERKIEVQAAGWIFTSGAERTRARRSLGLFKDWWISVFDLMSRVAYARSSEIVTLFEENRRLQVAGGAPPERCTVVPNGVDVDRFAGARARGRPLEEKDAPTIALVGRVVPIKDVKTFLRAAKLVVERGRPIDVRVVGPIDEDPAYYRECLLQAEMLGLERVVRFTGHMDLVELFRDLDCLVLSSLSEGQPLVLLEAMAAGVPCVATDVGDCRELLEGRSPGDRALGRSGLVCPIADYVAIAAAIERCVREPALSARLVAAGRARVERYYRKEQVLTRYLELYDGYRSRFASGERFGQRKAA